MVLVKTAERGVVSTLIGGCSELKPWATVLCTLRLVFFNFPGQRNDCPSEGYIPRKSPSGQFIVAVGSIRRAAPFVGRISRLAVINLDSRIRGW